MFQNTCGRSVTPLDTPVSPCDILVPLTPISRCWALCGAISIIKICSPTMEPHSPQRSIPEPPQSATRHLQYYKYVFVEAEGRLGVGVWGAEPPNGGMPAITNSEVISITPELLFPHLGAGENANARPPHLVVLVRLGS